eukprot:m.50223 g.50223  ORF g.50223 m.50223 type:complete len:195 (-) comp12136_c0_seq1:68-652(-)
MKGLTTESHPEEVAEHLKTLGVPEERCREFVQQGVGGRLLLALPEDALVQHLGSLCGKAVFRVLHPDKADAAAAAGQGGHNGREENERSARLRHRKPKAGDASEKGNTTTATRHDTDTGAPRPACPADDDTGSLWTELLRATLTLVIFFAMYLPFKAYILDPWRGIVPPPDLHKEILSNICPPGVECEHGPLNL